MPAVLTHNFFGRDAWPQVSEQLGFSSEDQHDAFLLGNQGPDVLFYLYIFPWVSHRNCVGGLMHHARPVHLLLALHDALDMLDESQRPVGEAYVAGFCCHYLLDRTMHPLVYYMEHGICDAGVEGLTRENHSDVHAEIERDLDEMVLYSKTGQTIKTFRSYDEVLHGSDELLAAIDKLYFYACLWTYSTTVDHAVYSSGVKAFRIMQRIFWTPNGRSLRILGGLERRIGRRPYSFYCAMAHRDRAEDSSIFANDEHLPWENPFTGELSRESFWELYEKAQAQLPEAEAALFSRGFDLPAAQRVTGGLNFSGEPVGELDPFELPQA